MNPYAIYSKTGKGVQEANGRTTLLPRADRLVLQAVDGRSSVSDLSDRFDKIDEGQFHQLIERLDNEGFIRLVEVRGGAGASAPRAPARTAPPPAGGDDSSLDLDFTQSMTPARRQPVDLAAQARAESERKAREEVAAAQRAREQAEARAREEAARMRKAREEAEARAREEAARLHRAREEAEARARDEAARLQRAREEAEARVRAERDAVARAQAEREAALARARADAEAIRARAEIEAKIRAETEARLRAEAEAKQRADAESKLRAEVEARLRLEAEARSRAEAEARLRADAETRALAEAQAQAEAKARAEAELRAKIEAETRARVAELDRAAAEARLRVEAETRARAEAEEQVRAAADAKVRAAAEARQRADAEARARAASETERVEAERKKREQAEREQREWDERRRREEDRRRQEEEQARRVAEQEARRRREAEDRKKREADALLADVKAFARDETAVARAQEESERKLREEQERRSDAEARQAAERRQTEERRQAEERRLREEEEARLRGEEDRLREEDARKQREEEERRRREEEERKRREREAREKRKREEAERRAKEKEARRVAKEEARKAKDAARALEPRRRKPPVRWGRNVTLLLLFGLLGAFVAVHLLSFSAESYERAARQATGLPVKIGALRVSLISGGQLRLEDITIGDTRIESVRLTPEIGSLFSDNMTFGRVEIEGAVVPQDALAQLLLGSFKAPSMKRARIVATKAKLVGPIRFPEFDAEIALTPEGALSTISLQGPDKLLAKLERKGAEYSVELLAGSFAVPFAPGVVLSDFGLKGIADRSGMVVREWSGLLADGPLSGNARIGWAGVWSVDGEIRGRNINAGTFLPALVSEGKASGRGSFSMSGREPARMSDNGRIQGDLKVERGALGAIDLMRTVQSGGKQSGGRTEFSSLTAHVVYDRGAVAVRGLNVDALPEGTGASGNADISRDGALSGRLIVEVKARSVIKSAYVLSGTAKEPVLGR